MIVEKKLYFFTNRFVVTFIPKTLFTYFTVQIHLMG